MQEFLQALGAIGFVLLVLVGLLAGWIASQAAGARHKSRYLLTGVIAALATPFVLAAVGVGVLAAGGLLAILAVAVLGAIAVLIIVKMIFD